MLAALCTSCKTSQKISGEYASQSLGVQCLYADNSGLQTLRSFGNGINRREAMENAAKNAIEATIFTGIPGSGACAKAPLVAEANAREKHQTYFDNFFRDKANGYGLYVKYKEKESSRVKSKNKTSEMWGCVVEVDRQQLRTRLVNDGIIK